MAQFTEIYVWGSSIFGQLGLGDSYIGQNINVPKSCSYKNVVQNVACGLAHSCLVINNSIYTMGNNEYGQLGLDLDNCISQPQLFKSGFQKVKAAHKYSVCFQDKELFAWGTCLALNLNGQRIIKTKDKIIKVSCGDFHLAFLSSNFEAYMLGSNDSGQLGLSLIETSTPAKLNFQNKIDSIKCGQNHTLLLSDHKVYSFGCNKYGQLGIGGRKGGSKIRQINIRANKIEASNFSAAITTQGELFIWGSGIFGEFDIPHQMDLETQIQKVKLGEGFGVILDINGQVHTFGKNSSGELAQKDYIPRAQLQHVKVLKNKKINKISCGSNFVICVSEINQKEIHQENNELDAVKKQNEELKSKIFELESQLKEYEQEIFQARDIIKTYSEFQFSGTQLDCKSFDLGYLNEQMEQKTCQIKDLQQIIENQDKLLVNHKQFQQECFRFQQEIQYQNKLIEEKNKQIGILNINIGNLERINQQYLKMINQDIHTIVKQFRNQLAIDFYNTNDTDKSPKNTEKTVKDLQNLLQKRINEIQKSNSLI
ncbi:hypothetical protein pb186bvf_017574 [Paramecium bursaria]